MQDLGPFDLILYQLKLRKLGLEVRTVDQRRFGRLCQAFPPFGVSMFVVASAVDRAVDEEWAREADEAEVMIWWAILWKAMALELTNDEVRSVSMFVFGCEEDGALNGASVGSWPLWNSNN